MTGVVHRGVLIVVALLLALPAATSAQTTAPFPGDHGAANAPAKRDTEPVVLRGSDLPQWSVPANQNARLPLVDFECQTNQIPEEIPRPEAPACQHNHYAQPHADTGRFQNDAYNSLGGAVAVDRLLGYRYDAAKKAWKQIPFQVDEVFTRYLNNAASGFAFFSGEDQHTTYAYDREGFRWFEN